MGKYSYEFKKKIVQEYFEGQGGYGTLATKYNVASTADVRKWVKSYSEFGDEGLLRIKKYKNYSFNSSFMW